MAVLKSLNDNEIIAALLHDVYKTHGSWFSYSAYRRTLRKVQVRLNQEGIGFLTKTLPRLGKAFDKALSANTPLNGAKLRFKTQPGSCLPRFLGEAFNRVLTKDGSLLPDPCVACVRVIRDVCYLYYKYKLPFTGEQEQEVVSKFVQTEVDLSTVSRHLGSLRVAVNLHDQAHTVPLKGSQELVVRRANNLLKVLFERFDPTQIVPRHGPGAVATKQRLWDKFRWTNVSENITRLYPLDAYFYASLGHVCDRLDEFKHIKQEDLPARVILVPKDSRGPRLISTEPVDYQWIQQGLGRALVDHVEHNALTRFNVFFTAQEPNQRGALLGSSTGRYATLDLNEASDRVSLELVRLLFPPRICEYLEACRSSSTVLPDGQVLRLNKFAPMGSCLCFPILALTVWSILTAAAPDRDTREGILVYGDDVIVPTAYAADAIEQLESFGLKINRDKSCTGGLFRESCGTDAFAGVNVTPVRLRTVWSSIPSPNVYTSWIEYSNSFYDRGYFTVYERIVEELHRIYGAIPSSDMCLTCPSLREVSDDRKPKRRRTNKSLQKLQWYVWDVSSPIINHEMDGWRMLLRFFTSATSSSPPHPDGSTLPDKSYDPSNNVSVSQYTRRGTSMLVRRWR
jgi:hypothetical protein